MQYARIYVYDKTFRCRQGYFMSDKVTRLVNTRTNIGRGSLINRETILVHYAPKVSWFCFAQKKGCFFSGRSSLSLEIRVFFLLSDIPLLFTHTCMYVWKYRNCEKFLRVFPSSILVDRLRHKSAELIFGWVAVFFFCHLAVSPFPDSTFRWEQGQNQFHFPLWKLLKELLPNWLFFSESLCAQRNNWSPLFPLL